jgi:hypothetical protein
MSARATHQLRDVRAVWLVRRPRGLHLDGPDDAAFVAGDQ